MIIIMSASPIRAIASWLTVLTCCKHINASMGGYILWVSATNVVGLYLFTYMYYYQDLSQIPKIWLVNINMYAQCTHCQQQTKRWNSSRHFLVCRSIIELIKNSLHHVGTSISPLRLLYTFVLIFSMEVTTILVVSSHKLAHAQLFHNSSISWLSCGYWLQL